MHDRYVGTIFAPTYRHEKIQTPSSWHFETTIYLAALQVKHVDLRKAFATS